MVWQRALKLKNFHETNMTFTDVESNMGEAVNGRGETKGVWLTFKRQDNQLENGWHEQLIKRLTVLRCLNRHIISLFL